MEARFPNLIDYTDGDQQAMVTIGLADALVDVDETVWGVDYERGQEYLAAHLTVGLLADAEADAAGGGSAFPVQQASADGVSMTLAVPTDIPPALATYYTSRYGVKYLELLRRRTGGPHLVV